eukprot:g8756.t1
MARVHVAPVEANGPSHRHTASLESVKDSETAIRTVHFNFSSSPNDLSTNPSINGVVKFANNYVRTSRYTIYNFLVINLFEQFSRVANLYFLLIAVLQLVPGLSPTHWFTTLAPLIFVLMINAVKEIYDDYYRHKSDDEVNNRLVQRLDSDDEEFVKWRDLTVGSIVRVQKNEEIPADLVFLSSSDPAALCYLETANLDGETNLKLKYCHQSTASCNSSRALIRTLLNSHIECEAPNERLYQFDGSIVTPMEHRVGLDASNLLLRGCTLRKTDWILGVVVFAGIDSKIQRNQSSGKRKVTQIERHMNILVILVFILQVLLSIVGAVGRELWLASHTNDYYLEPTNGWPDLGRGWIGGIVTMLRFVILLNQLIPISLYVTLELVKVIQCLFLNWDRQMYHTDSDTPFLCRTTTLNEDLGQVQYILSDKTGTLTQNVMGWVWASVNGSLYGLNPIPHNQTHSGSSGVHPHSIVYDQELRSVLNKDSDGQRCPNQEYNKLAEFLINLVICNTVVPTTDANGQLQYQAESPDEEALIHGAATLGFKLISRTTEKIEIEAQGKLLRFEILAVLEFNSDRKRMSVICKTQENEVRLYCKGADGVIFTRLNSVQNDVLESTRTHLELMAKQGYRTLAIAQKRIAPEEYTKWKDEYHLASVALKDREIKLSKTAELIERDLTLLGATAVEDKLQDGVPEAIECLSEAGIRIWVLTGDKLETAVSISHSCSLFHSEMQLVYITESDINKNGRTGCLDQKELEVSEASRSIGLVIDGGALTQLLKTKYQIRFLTLCQKCDAVVCCRVSPMQKAQVTNLVRKKGRAITLAIGDGANDVGMIQAAHIGVGISGREGRAAVLSSDFAIAQFAFIKRLLLVHGRWSYKRNAEVVWYAFYKNFAYCLANVYLNFFFAGFSSQPVYGSILIATFNVFWTSLPTISFAILEQDVLSKTVLVAPKLYRETMDSNRVVFFKHLGQWLLEGLWHSIVAFGVPLWALSVPVANGKLLGLDETGVAVYTSVILLVNLKIALRTQHWTWINSIFVFVISIGFWFPFVLTCSFIWEWYEILPEMSGVAQRLFQIPNFWISSIVVAPILGLFLDSTLIAFENRFWPSDSRIYQERELVDDLQKQSKSQNSRSTV